MPPFVNGGGSLIADWLNEELKTRGYDSDFFKIPFTSEWKQMPEQMLSLRLMDITRACDLLITIRTPSYLLKHPNKVVWFIHHHRGAYDLWGTQHQDVPNTEDGLAFRNFLYESDRVGLYEAKKVFANSKIIANRLETFNGIKAPILLPPIKNPERFYCSDFDNYFFYPSRISFNKRQIEAVQSMAYVKSPVKLIIAGKPDSEEDGRNLNNMIADLYLGDKVIVKPFWIPEKEKEDLYANALGCVYIPMCEDSYGYVSLEAMHSKKPVITCRDSGGTLELIEDQVNGLVVPLNPHEIAKAMDSLYYDKNKTKKMGIAGHEKLKSMNLNWDHVIRQLVQ